MTAAMEREVDQAHLSLYTGGFSRDTIELSEHIRKIKEDYDRYDPKTWPVITPEYLKSHLGQEYDGSWLLPCCVAYTRSLVDKCASSFKDESVIISMASGRTVERGLFYHYFPFVFDRSGRARCGEYMTSEDYKHWIGELTGTLTYTHGHSSDSHPLKDSKSDVVDLTMEMDDDLQQQLVQALWDLEEQRKHTRMAFARIVDLEKQLIEEKRIGEEKFKNAMDMHSKRLNEVRQLQTSLHRAHVQLRGERKGKSQANSRKPSNPLSLTDLAKKLEDTDEQVKTMQAQMRSIFPSTTLPVRGPQVKSEDNRM